MSSKPFVLVVGARGVTGKIIMKALIQSGGFRLGAMIRPATAPKPDVDVLRGSGVEIRLGDLGDSVEQLTQVLEDVDIVISAVDAVVILQQKNLVLAAKAAGVKRFVPCDFGTPGAQGVRELLDQKLEIHRLVESIDLPYTYIDVGWWADLYLPMPSRAGLPPQVMAMSNTLFGAGDKPNLLINPKHIGDWVVRVIADPRTLDQSVIVWDDEISQVRALEIADRVSGEGDTLRATRGKVSLDDLAKTAQGATERIKANPEDAQAHIQQSWSQYQMSMHFLGENTLENAKRLGYLDGQELYPDAPKQTFEEFAKELYAREDPGSVYKRVQ